MNNNILEILYLKKGIKAINEYISNNLSDRLLNVLIAYGYIEPQDENNKYIKKCIKHHIIKNAFELNLILVNSISVGSVAMKNCVEKLKSNMLIIQEITNLKKANIAKLQVSQRKKEKLKMNWQEMSAPYRALFNNETEYKNDCIFSDNYSFVASSELKARPEVKAFFAELEKKDHTLKDQTNNNGEAYGFQAKTKNYVEDFAQVQLKDHKKFDENYIKHIGVTQKIEEYINQKIIIPILKKLLSTFKSKQKVNVEDIYDYVISSYKPISAMYYLSFINGAFAHQTNDEALIKDLSEVIYIEILHEHTSSIVMNSPIPKEVSSKSKFKKLDNIMKSLYGKEDTYNKWLALRHYSWKQPRDKINQLLQDSKKLLGVNLGVIQEEEKANSSYYDTFKNLFNKVYENKVTIGLTLLAIAGGYAAYTNTGGVLSKLQTAKGLVRTKVDEAKKNVANRFGGKKDLPKVGAQKTEIPKETIPTKEMPAILDRPKKEDSKGWFGGLFGSKTGIAEETTKTLEAPLKAQSTTTTLETSESGTPATQSDDSVWGKVKGGYQKVNALKGYAFEAASWMTFAGMVKGIMPVGSSENEYGETLTNDEPKDQAPDYDTIAGKKGEIIYVVIKDNGVIFFLDIEGKDPSPIAEKDLDKYVEKEDLDKYLGTK